MSMGSRARRSMFYATGIVAGGIAAIAEAFSPLPDGSAFVVVLSVAIVLWGIDAWILNYRFAGWL
jgi:hypothetical protein